MGKMYLNKGINFHWNYVQPTKHYYHHVLLKAVQNKRFLYINIYIYI